MPELRLFRRRWHIATDTFPIVATLLAAVHGAFIIPFITGAYTIESTGIENDCEVGTAVRVAVYGMVLLIMISTIAELSIVSIGLKGGPLEEGKRYAMAPLLYGEVCLWIAILAWTVYGTYIVKSPSVSADCWANNPCAYSDQLPAACVGPRGSNGVRTLSEPCKAIVSNEMQWGYCFQEWFMFGTGYVFYQELATDPVKDPWSCNLAKPDADAISTWLSDTFFDGNATALAEWAEAHANDEDDAAYDINIEATGGSRSQVEEYNLQLKGYGRLTRDVEMTFLNNSGITVDPEAVGASAPWFDCQNSTCQHLIQSSDTCQSWDVLLALPNPSSRKAFFEGLIWASWAVLVFEVVLVLIAFNSFPDYDEVDSWEGSLRNMSRLFCCGSTMQDAVLETSEAASREIAKSLNMLFGGIDLDPTDRLFAALLVAEHQSEQRQKHLRHMLERAGYVTQPPRRGAFIKGQARRDGGTLDHHRSSGSEGWSTEGNSPSPRWKSSAEGRSPLYRRTTVRLNNVTLEEEALRSRSKAMTGRANRKRAAQLGINLKLVDWYVPMLTPVRLPLAYCGHISPLNAANIYCGPKTPVPLDQLQLAQQMSGFAIAAYGLQSIKWGKGRRPPTCGGNINLLTKLLGKVFRLETKFRQRNCDAILEVTGAEAEDLLYVSYANTSGGALPYLVMRHRPSNSLVIAVRGTVSMEDLITDLLSKPVDVSEWLPAWVQEKSSDGPMYVHAGVVSAATAILMDMEEKGLLKELLARSQRSAMLKRLSTRAGGCGMPRMQSMCRSRSSQDVMALSPPAQPNTWHAAKGELEKFFTLDRVRELLRKNVHQPLRLTITGHSLGAAVACMLSFQMRQECPDLKCWAYCPPGGLMSWNLAQVSQEFCTSVVVGKDVISRLSFNALKRTVDEMVVCLARCRRPKLMVLGDVLMKRRGANRIPPPTLCEVDELPDESMLVLDRYFHTSHLHNAHQPEMYPPGNLMFLRPFKSGTEKKASWDAVWVSAIDLMGEGIQLSPSMMEHHRLYNLAEAFGGCLAAADLAAQVKAVSFSVAEHLV